eukprot:CAMPEP_0185903948 /NCGR_PEP_ID=MMETSP0196C-20130402/3250_1 /TAXON_ID=2932 /ORGANISM="Alexandrium fundyense, Strain CCMP1719" /LENGTH=50 /DNA_ID=CAMNT_0028623123 /DNA_START=238 /DNA_END=387 /DNA_ORIENTATION=+
MKPENPKNKAADSLFAERAMSRARVDGYWGQIKNKIYLSQNGYGLMARGR